MEQRSNCAVNFTIENIGDKWSFLIVRDIVLDNKHFYSDFINSDEKISSNILASRLVDLEKKEILAKYPLLNDRKKIYYTLTQKGRDLIPVMLEMIIWGHKYDPHTKSTAKFINMARNHRKELVKKLVSELQTDKARQIDPSFQPVKANKLSKKNK